MKTFLLCLVSVASSAQVLYVNVTAGGSYGATPPTVTASGGSCTSEPTFTAVINANAVSAVNVTFAGLGCTTAPTLAFNPTGASATAVLLSATIAILSTPTVLSDQSAQVSVSGTNKLYRYECTLTVPAALVPVYALALTPTIDRMPFTSQTSQLIWSLVNGASALQPYYNTAFANGIFTIYDGSVNVNSATTLSVVEAIIQSNCAQWQTDLNAWNPWANYGTYFSLSGTWNSIGVP
jgi:hypothetical protein